MPLPINIEALLSARTVESDRIEFKAGWNPDAIYHSICAFANDFDNVGGSYILIGFNNLINLAYFCRLCIENIDNNQLIVLWVPGETSRPYEVPESVTSKEKRYFYYIRQYANSIK
jgi:ATP-dependent DNA helicase RecG